VGNHTVSGLLQREIRVGDETYSIQQNRARDFRRTLMITLQANRFKELGTRAMWDTVEGWLRGNPPPPRPFETWGHLVAELNDRRLLEARHRRAHLGPTNLGPRPRLQAAVRAAVRPQQEEDARHVLSSSSLGLAIQNAPATLARLNGWLGDHGGNAVDSSNPLADREARRRIWDIAANHTGNLFPGPAGSNEAAGLIRGPLKYVAERLNGRENEAVPLSDIRLPTQPQFTWPEFDVHWRLIVEDLDAELKQLAGPHGNTVPGGMAKELIQEYIENADVDLPFQQLRPGYYEKLVPLIAAVRQPDATFFAANGALHYFMTLDWRD
jgi:hypothetical protein